jgi:hypothetical protein
MRLHPEKKKHAKSPDEMVKGVFMAVARTALENETFKTLGRIRLPTAQVKKLDINYD